MNNKTIYPILILLVLAIPLVFALEAVSQTDIFYVGDTDTPVEYVQEMIYLCDDISCSSQGQTLVDSNSGNSNSFYFHYFYNPSSTNSSPDYFAHFSFAECYLPKEYIEEVWGHDYDAVYEYGMNKAEGCHSPIDSFSVLNTQYENEPVVIDVAVNMEADVYSAFTDFYLDWFPEGYEDYYSVETDVILEIFDEDDNVVETQTETLNILMDTSQNVQFSWTPDIEGEYSARVTTNVVDCQCESSSTVEQFSEKEFTVYEERPHDECYTLMNDLVASPQFAQEGQQVAITFTKLSNYVGDVGDYTAIPTDVVLEIFNSNNALVYSDSETFDASSTTTPQTETFYWTPDESGSYSIRVTGVGSSCPVTTNPEEVLTLGFIVNEQDEPPEEPPEEPETYDLTFVVSDADTGTELEDAYVDIGNLAGFTDDDGEITFEVEAGTYDWEVSLGGYEDEDGTIVVDGGETVEVELESISPETYDVIFVVSDNDTGSSLANAFVEFGTTLSGFTDDDGEITFEVEAGTYDWNVELDGYEDDDGTVVVDGDETVEVELISIAEEPESITTVSLDYPGGGEVLSGIINVLWTAVNNLGHELSVFIYYSDDSGNNWNSVAEDLDNTGSYSFDTEALSDGNYLLRVCAFDSVASEIVCDESGSEFEIANAEEEEEEPETELEENEKSKKESYEFLSFGDPYELEGKRSSVYEEDIDLTEETEAGLSAIAKLLIGGIALIVLMVVLIGIAVRRK